MDFRMKDRLLERTIFALRFGVPSSSHRDSLLPTQTTNEMGCQMVCIVIEIRYGWELALRRLPIPTLLA